MFVSGTIDFCLKKLRIMAEIEEKVKKAGK